MEHDAHAAELLKDLRRRGGCGGGWGVVKTAVFGFLTFGIAPAIAWTFAMREQVESDRDLYTRAADWFRFHSVHPEAGRLRAAAGAMYGRPFLSVLPIVCCLGVFLFFLTSTDRHRDRLGAARRATHNYPVAERVRDVRERGLESLRDDFGPRDKLYLVWAGGLSAAYLALWGAFRSHATGVYKFSEAFDRFAAAEGIRPPARPLVRESPARWWAGALILPNLGFAWAPAAMLAGGSRRRFAVSTSAPLRRDLAHAIDEMARVRRGTIDVAGAVPMTRCARPSCVAPLPVGARFCRRCGARTTDGIGIRT